MINLELKGKNPVVGFGLTLGSLRSVEIASKTRFHFAMIDMLHSYFDRLSATTALRILACSKGPAPFARVAGNDPGAINELLDAGAVGIIIPMVNSADEAEQAVQSAYYPPVGKRSKGSPASIFYGKDYFDQINSYLKLIVMIETPEGVEKADEIQSVPGISGCLIGAGDLSFTMKCSKESPEFKKAIYKIIDVSPSNGPAIGISIVSSKEIEFWRKRGISFFLASHDLTLLNNGIRAYDEEFSRYNNNNPK